MRTRPRLLVPAVMSVLLLAALAFAIVAGKGSTSPSSGGTTASPATPAAGGTVGTSSAGAEFDGAALPAGVLAPGFTLERAGGGTVSLASLRGRTVLLAFLYSHCGGPCVLIAQQIRGALDQLPAGTAQAVIVSADPAHEDAASVRTFLAQVGLSGRADYLTGTMHRLQAVWRAYHVRPASAGKATFARYATVLLIDARGRERVLYGSEQLTPEALAHDIGRIDGIPAHP